MEQRRRMHRSDACGAHPLGPHGGPIRTPTIGHVTGMRCDGADDWSPRTIDLRQRVEAFHLIAVTSRWCDG